MLEQPRTEGVLALDLRRQTVPPRRSQLRNVPLVFVDGAVAASPRQ